MEFSDNRQPTEQERIATAVSRAFLEVVPAEFRTHCVLCSQVVSSCIDRLGYPNRVAPCQLLCNYNGRGVLLGFTGKAVEGRWDGHVVVRWRDLLFDFATATFQRDYGFELPAVVIAPCVTLPSNLKAKIVTGPARLMWLRPPPGADTTLPAVDANTIAKYSDALFAATSRQLAQPRAA